MTTNAAQELIKHAEGRKIKCAVIHDDADRYGDAPRQEIILRVGHTEVEYNIFISQLNWPYDSGYGGQIVFGTVWYEDGTWSERGEYDGSEWWEHRELPVIPEELQPLVLAQTNTILIGKE